MKQLLKDKRKEQIMNAALNVISVKGYDQSRMDDIVLESDLSKGAIYWYYKSKKDIYLSLVDHWVSEYSSGMFEALDKTQSASGKLKKLFDLIKHFCFRRRNMLFFHRKRCGCVCSSAILKLQAACFF